MPFFTQGTRGGFANLESLEGTVSEEKTLTLARKSRKITITNDHPTSNLTFKFNASESVATLKGTESVTIFFITKQIIINGTDVPYRIWVFG